jgi:uracil-DNA glycosylase family 4
MFSPKVETGLKKINEKIQACTKCELCQLVENKKDISKGYGKLYGWRGGKKKCRFLFVGMNPSYNRFAGHEYAFGGVEGSPGPGEKFNNLLKETGIFDEIFCDNIIHCSSSTNAINNAWSRACFPFLLEEVKVLKPQIIIAMGRQVFEILLNMCRENNIRIPIKSIWHPSYVFSYQRSTPEEYKAFIMQACKE